MYKDFILSDDNKAKDLEEKIITLLKENDFSLAKSNALFKKIIIDLECTPLNKL